MKKRVSAVLTAAMAVGTVWAVPTVARAADPYPDVMTGSWEERVIVNTSDVETKVPRGLKAHVRKKGSPTRLATLTSFTRRPDAPCTWGDYCGSEPLQHSTFQSDPVKLPEIGTYTIDLEYTGTTGETVVHEDNGVLSYTERPVISNLKSSAVSVENLDTVLSGDLSVYNPLDGSSKPYAGGAFTAKRGLETTARTADAQGHFEAKFRITHTDFLKAPADGQVKFSLATELNGRGDIEGVTVPVAPVEADMALASPTVTGAYGTGAKISGTATWKSADGTRKPLPTTMPVIAGNWNSGSTDATGRFTLTRRLTEDGVLNVKPHSVWFDSKATLKVDVTPGTFFQGFTAGAGADRYVYVSSTFWRGEFPEGTTSLNVDVEFSADGKTGWTSRKSVAVPTKPGWNAGGYKIEQKLPYTGPGYVRLRYAGTPSIPGSVTPAVRFERTNTAIPEFNAAPEPAKKGTPITVTGKLNHADPTWKPLAGQRVDYYFRPAGSTAWTWMGLSTTAADGTFRKSFTANRTGSWQARYGTADNRHLNAVSRVDEVVVTP
ncbi:hypothetical protein ACE1OC_23505 [Streptomyces sp. DSM 116496]|uniref:hypothetical protein n=1 Tax=Streptomyces stoeckheimensis TaxID=3344656 RepID=UPI0038B36A5E